MSGYLLDTHIWFWYLTGSQRLPRRLRRLIDEHRDACFLSPISVWELGMLAARGRIRIQEQVSRRFGLAPPVEVRYDDYTEDTEEKYKTAFIGNWASEKSIILQFDVLGG